MTSGVDCLVFGERVPTSDGVQVWSDSRLVKWNWDVPRIFQASDSKRKEGDDYLVASIRSFVDAVHGVKNELFVSGRDLRQALEIAIASKLSAQLGNQPVKLPLKDRTLSLLPSSYR
jgi:hypothetical protein